MATTSGLTSEGIRTDYMTLLVAQLKNQNPLEPMDNVDMATQLAQLSQLEQLENMSGTFQQVLQAAQRSQAASLIGRQISFIPDGRQDPILGRVDAVEITNEDVNLRIGDLTIALADILSITD